MAKMKFLVTASVGVLASVFPVAVYAQEGVADERRDEQVQSNVIIVTAQKREERLLDVPVSISAIDSEALTNQNINRISEYFDRVPGLQFSGQRIRNLSLRGITTGGATSPTIAVLVDDVQFGGTTGGQTPIPDFDASALERIEVLRGPQGTLYGAASLGGLIKYVLKEPSTSEIFGRVEVGASTVSGGEEGWVTRGTLNVPISEGVAVLGSGFYRDDPAYLDNVNPAAASSEDVNTRETWGFRGAVLLEPFDNLRIVGSALYQEQDAINSDLQITSGGVPICAACYPPSANFASAPVTFDPVVGDLTLNTLDSTNFSKYSVYSARAELDLGDAEVTSITAWSKADNIITADVTAVFLNLFQLPFTYQAPAGSSVTIGNADETHKFSQELRISGATNSFDWIAGAFYTNENTSVDQSIFLNDPSGSQAAVPYAGRGPGSYKEYAGFGAVTWHITDQFDLQVGGRYAKNKQTSAIDVIIDQPAVPLFGPSGLQAQDSEDDAFTWLISPSYHFAPDMMGYIRIATGYRPGGPNIEDAVFSSYGPDRVTNYEIGFKGEVVRGLLTLDTSLFQIDWKNIQLQGTAASQQTFITNGGTARSRGIEFSASVTPWEGMAISTNLTVTDAELTEDLPFIPQGVVGMSGDPLPFTADFAANISADQDFYVSDTIEATVGFSLIHLGERPSEFLTSSATRERFEIPSYTTVDLRGGLTFDEKWSVKAYVRNLFNERGIAVAQARNGNNVPTALFIQPRTFGIILGRSF